VARRTRNKGIYLFLLLLPIFIFFSPAWMKGKLPIPADTIVGMYHPFRDVVWKGLTAGVPFKNFLITDAIRQQYPWRELAIDLLKSGQYPGWNPYTHAGTPLAANIQTALFYPLNILFFLLPFPTAWSIEVILQPLLLALFLFAFLTDIGVSKKAASIASLSLALSGFSVAWLEWNTTLHTLVWVPLALLGIERIVKQERLIWYLTLAFALVSILFAGFLQTSFYAIVVILAYAGVRLWLSGRKTTILKLSLVVIAVGALTAVQWVPTAKLLRYSAREIDQGDVLMRQDWFLPWQNLVQFVAPDFFGNPATLNYWGAFNYTEFIGYVGMIPLAFALTALFTSSGKKSFQEKFFICALVLSLIFALSNPLSRIPFQLNLPLISTAQPSRLMMIVDLCLALLAAFGLDRFFKDLRAGKGLNRHLLIALSITAATIGGLWVFTFGKTGIDMAAENLKVAQRNLILPTMLIVAAGITLMAALHLVKLRVKNKTIIHNSLFIVLFILTSADLLRFSWKFTPFSDKDYLYPQTETVRFLAQDKSPWRYITTDARIFPPNFSIPYRFQTLEGYDPIYIRRFGQLIASSQKGEPTLEPTPFHRIIRPDNYASPIVDLLNVKYVVSLTDLLHPKLEKVFQEGETRVYKNNQAFPRAFLIPNYVVPNSERQSLEQAFSMKKEDVNQSASIMEYRENEVGILVDSQTGGMLVLSDTYYPGWTATLDGTGIEIHQVLYSLRGTMVPSGRHEILYRYSEL